MYQRITLKDWRQEKLREVIASIYMWKILPDVLCLYRLYSSLCTMHATSSHWPKPKGAMLRLYKNTTEFKTCCKTLSAEHGRRLKLKDIRQTPFITSKCRHTTGSAWSWGEQLGMETKEHTRINSVINEPNQCRRKKFQILWSDRIKQACLMEIEPTPKSAECSVGS